MLPESVERIEDLAFYKAKLTSIHIPRRVTYLGSSTFSYSTVETVTFDEDSQLNYIDRWCFNRCEQLKSIVLPDNVETLRDFVFMECYALESAVLPAALKKLDEQTFIRCSSLESLVLQEGLETVAKSAVSNSGKLTELVIPSTVTAIGDYAFEYATELKTLTFTEGSVLHQIGQYAFGYCSSLESLTLPANLTTFVNIRGGDSSYLGYNSRAFIGCSALKYVDMSACEELTELPSAVFSGCTAIESIVLPPNLETIHNGAFGSNSVNNALKSLKEITIPASVTSIGGYVFANCTALETVIFEAGSPITELGAVEKRSDYGGWGFNMFLNTPALKKVVLPENLTLIGNSCFENSGVAEINMPSSVNTIVTKAFYNCANIVDAGLSANLQYLGDEAYRDCEKLEIANLNFGLEYLGSMAFANCVSLKRAYIPATVTSISGNPFMGCSGVESFKLDEDSTSFVVVDGVLYDTTMYTLLYYPASLTAETFEIPATVHEIGAGAFAGAQLKHFVFPERFKEIPDYAFQNAAIESFTFHKSITRVGDYAFDGCKNLNNVTLPNSVKYAGYYAFANCTSLSNFQFEDVVAGEAPYQIGQHFFDGCTALTQAVFPNYMTITDKEANSNWDIQYAEMALPGYMFANSGITSVVIPAWVKDLGSPGVFQNCKNLETAIFAAKMMEGDYIGEYFFAGCTKLKEVEIPCGLYYPFCSYTFAGCSALERVAYYTEYSDGIEVYGGHAFDGCDSLKFLEIWTVVEFEYDDDENVIGYAELTPDYLYCPSAYTFAGIGAMKFMAVGNPSEAYLANYLFADSSIETVWIRGTSELPGKTFAGAKALKEVWIHLNDDWYGGDGTNAFAELENVTNIYFYDRTYDEVVELIGSDAWFTTVSEKAHFYFKDTMPADAVWPDEGRDSMK